MGASILVVEDDRPTRWALVVMLSQMGLLVSEAATAAEAIAKLDQLPDLVCLDLILPDDSGLSVLRHIRHHRLTCKVAIISGANDSHRLTDLTNLKPDAIFGKPLDASDFCDWLGTQAIEPPKQAVKPAENSRQVRDEII